MKWKKDHKIPNSKAKLSEAAIARASASKSGFKHLSNFDGDSDNLDDSSNVDYNEFDDDDNEGEGEDDEEYDNDLTGNDYDVYGSSTNSSRINNKKKSTR